MTISRVRYERKNMGAYFGGSNDYWETAEKFFTTEEKANAFIANEEREWVETWGREEVVKFANRGRVEAVIVE